MEYEYKVLIDSKEFQQKLLDLISNEEQIDKFFNSTIFSVEENRNSHKAAMIHGMCIASMITSYCEPILIKNKIEK